MAAPVVQQRDVVATGVARTSGWLTADRSSLLLLSGALLLTLLLYLPTLGYWWVADDYNFAIPKPPEQIANFFLFQKWRIFYRPLTWISCVFDYQVWGWHPTAWRLENILLKLTCVTLVWQLVRKLSGREIVAGLAALLFAIGPSHPAAVTFVQGRADSLSTVFYLATATCFFSYLRQPHRWWLYLASGGFAILGIGAKEMGLTVPAVLLLGDLLLLPQPELRARRWFAFLLAKLRRHWLPLVVCGGYVGLRLFYAAMRWSALGYGSKYDFNEIRDNVAGFLGQLVGVPAINPLKAGLGVAFLASFALAAMLLAWYGGRLGWLGLAWIVITIVPVANIPVIESDSRYLYLPSVGLVMLLAAALARLSGQQPTTNERLVATARLAMVVALTAGLVGFGGWATVNYNQEYYLSGDSGQRMLAQMKAAVPTPAAGSRIFIAGLPYEYKRVIIYGAGVYWAIRMNYDNNTSLKVYERGFTTDFAQALAAPNPPPSYYFAWQGDVTSGRLVSYPTRADYQAVVQP